MTPQPSQRAEDLARQIQEVFANIPYPGDGCLTEGHSSEAFDIGNWLKGRRWQDLGLEELARNHESLFFMTPQAIRYYLQAFLLASVLRYREANPLPSTVLFFLTFPKTREDRSRFRTRFDLFTKPQSEAIRAFLEFIRDEYPEDHLQANEIGEMLDWWSGKCTEDLDIDNRPTANRRSGFLTLLGSGLAVASILGLGIILWFFRLNPSNWYVLMGKRGENAVSGWTITVVLMFTLSLGLLLVALAQRRKQLR